jgi:CRISPR-associated exonuclease Cas4/CRISPR-associated protein Cas1
MFMLGQAFRVGNFLGRFAERLQRAARAPGSGQTNLLFSYRASCTPRVQELNVVQMAEQFELPLPAPAATDDESLVPARMLNEWVYCPRLAYLEWVEGSWEDNEDTAQGKRAHIRADKPGPALPAPEEAGEDAASFRTRAVMLASQRLGLIAKIDVLEGEGGLVTPVDYKKGKRPHVEKGAYDPERVQVCAQGLILEDNGYKCEEGALWFSKSRERVRIPFDEELRSLTLKAASELRLAAAARRAPPPLENSPKCPRCSLLPICLPDEVRFFDRTVPPRPLPPPADTALPLYVQTPGARISKMGDELIIKAEGAPDVSVPIADVSDLVLAGPVSLSTPALHELMRQGRPVAWMSSGFWFMGSTGAQGPRSALARTAQYEKARDPLFSLRFSRALVAAKIKNQRTLLRRNGTGEAAEKAKMLERLRQLGLLAEEAKDTSRLLGVEGEAASLYFAAFSTMLSASAPPAFDFTKRTRRPPADPINACLSLSYALLTRTWEAALSIAGLDPWKGFFHVERPGRPALALDLIEPFRPIIADSAVIGAINNGEIGADDFIVAGPGCNLKPHARKKLIAAYERRLDQETTHSVFGYRISTRRLIHVQARLLVRHLLGETPDYPHYLPR